MTGYLNPNWKGGRVLASNGYVLIRVGIHHHLADSRGYAYEHRLVAEQKEGRRLLEGEIVHHIDEDKQNNNPDNLELKTGIAEHLSEHRKRTDLRQLDEDNPLIKCGCGCGETFHHYDETNRPRQFISGHNPMNSPLVDQIISLVSANESVSLSFITEQLNYHERPGIIRTTLSRLVNQNRLARETKGVYKLKSPK